MRSTPPIDLIDRQDGIGRTVTLLPARGPPLWEMPGTEPGDIDPQFQPAPDYAAQQIPFWDDFDQRIAW